MTTAIVPEASQPVGLGGVMETFCDGISNAENITVTGSGRAFVTGRDGVFEIVGTAGNRCEKKLVPVRVAGIPARCMNNGIAAYGDSLYLACAHFHDCGVPLLRAFIPDMNSQEQTAMSLVGAYLAASVCAVDSYVVRCDLAHTPAAFTQLVATLTGKGVANGIAVGGQGADLYVAISASAGSAGIYKSPTRSSDGGAEAALWCRLPGYKPNGLKVIDDSLYYTGNGMLSAAFGSVSIQGDGSAGDPHIIYAASPAFDDFAVGANGFVISQFYWAVPFLHGALHFVSKAGNNVGVLRRSDIQNPAAVALVKAKHSFCDPGDVLIVDKGRRCVSVFRPDTALRKWLSAA